MKDAKYMPNKTAFARALFAFGEDPKSPVFYKISPHDHTPINLAQANNILASKTPGGRDANRWMRIIDALKEQKIETDRAAINTSGANIVKPGDLVSRYTDGTARFTTAPLTHRMTREDMMAAMDGRNIRFSGGKIILGFDQEVRDAITKGAHTPDTDPRAVATLKREIKNKDELIARLKRENQSGFEARSRDAQTQSMAIHEKDLKINEQKSEIASLETQIKGLKAWKQPAPSFPANVEKLQRQITALTAKVETEKARANRMYKQAQNSGEMYNDACDTIKELEDKLEAGGANLDAEQTIQMLKDKLAEAKSDWITWEQACRAVQMGRWLPSKNEDDQKRLYLNGYQKGQFESAFASLTSVLNIIDGMPALYRKSSKGGKTMLAGNIADHLGIQFDNYGMRKEQVWADGSNEDSILYLAQTIDDGVRNIRENAEILGKLIMQGAGA